MTFVTTSQAQALLPRLLASVAQGEEVLITDGGLPVARLIQPAIQRPAPLAPSAQAETPDTDQVEEDDRPWRCVFAIESPGETHSDGPLHLPSEPQLPEPRPAGILWDRMDSLDECAVVSSHRRCAAALAGRPDSGLPRVDVEASRSGDDTGARRSRHAAARMTWSS